MYLCGCVTVRKGYYKQIHFAFLEENAMKNLNCELNRHNDGRVFTYVQYRFYNAFYFRRVYIENIY